ncbi:MAG: pilus assembly protein, partial [Burkholderiales bacterium]
STNQWKTILVGGLNAGGRGYYALDVTDPNAPKGLWEFCADPTGTLQCTEKDDNVGYTYGQPIITKDAKDDKWVVIVSSGYNNVLPGDGKGYLYILDVETGKLNDKKDTNVGDTTTPSGYAKITGFATNFAVNNTTTFVYGGDLLGNMFSFDMANRQFNLLGQARDASGKIQSITTRPDVTRFDTPAPAFNVVYFGTGRFLGATDVPDPLTLVPPVLDQAYQQTVYGIKDTGANLGDLRASGAKLVQQTMSVVDPTSRTVSKNAVDWTTQNGWFVDLNPSIPPAPPGTPPGDSPGERVSIDPQLVKGVLLVVTNEPNSDACSTGGDAFLYQFDYQTGSYVASAPDQVVGVKLGSALAAGFVVYRLPSGQLKLTNIDVTGVKKTAGVNPGGGGALGSRVSWRELY